MVKLYVEPYKEVLPVGLWDMLELVWEMLTKQLAVVANVFLFNLDKQRLYER
jgi:hypothetical protein